MKRILVLAAFLLWAGTAWGAGGTTVSSGGGGTTFAGTESTTGSAGSLKSPATTGVTTITGPGAGTTRVITIPDANNTIPAFPASTAKSIVYINDAGVWAVLTCDGANQMVGRNAANDGWECKSTLNLSTVNLPSSNSDPGTTAGQIKHDSTDTGSNSGGTAKWYDGANVRSLVDTGTNYTIITKTEFLPIAWAVDGATAPAAIADVTGKEIKARAFTEADDVVFWWIVPNDYVGGIKYRVLYALSANANADDTAVFSMAGSIVANSGDLDGSAGTALTISDELTTDDDQYQVMITDYTAESNADWSLSAGGLARLNFSHAAASDMAGAGEPLVIGIEIKYKAKIIGLGGY